MTFTRRCIALLLIALMMFCSSAAYAAPTATPTPTLPPFDELVPEYDENNPGALSIDQLYAQAAILIDRDTGKVLLEKNADMRMNPASTTKIMTILLALEYGDINKVVVIPPEAADIPSDSSVVPVTPGEEMTFMDLLYGFMLKSGNDAGNAIAVLIAGSVDNFVDMMNDRAAELGCTNTHFVNPHGYTAEGHYTSARDMAIITQEAMKHYTFRKIVGTGEHQLQPTTLRGAQVIQNSNLMLVWGSQYRYKYATGVKTGTTSAAGQCLVGSATKDIGDGTSHEVNLISVVFKSTVAFPHAKWQDTRRMMEYGFSQYVTYDFDDLYEMLNLVVPISGAEAGDPSGGMIGLNAMMNRSGSYEQTILRNELPDLLSDFRSRVSIKYTHNLKAPIEVGTLIGELTFTAEDGKVLTAILVADRSVAAAPKVRQSFSIGEWFNENVPVPVRIVLVLIVVFIVILIISRMVLAARERRRRRIARERARARRIARERAAAQARRNGVPAPKGAPRINGNPHVKGTPTRKAPPSGRPPRPRG